jgi:hypothetical protein
MKKLLPFNQSLLSNLPFQQLIFVRFFPLQADWVSPLSSGKWRRKEIQIILPASPKL